MNSVLIISLVTEVLAGHQCGVYMHRVMIQMMIAVKVQIHILNTFLDIFKGHLNITQSFSALQLVLFI